MERTGPKKNNPYNSLRMIGDFIVRDAMASDFKSLGNDLIQMGVGDVSRYADNPFALINSFCFIYDTEVMGIGGYIIFWPGVAEAWSLWKKKAGEKHKKSMIKAARTLNEEFINEYKIWRLQAMCPANISNNWFEHMGFEKECTFRCFSQIGLDTDMYCKIIERHLPVRN